MRRYGTEGMFEQVLTELKIMQLKLLLLLYTFAFANNIRLISLEEQIEEFKIFIPFAQKGTCNRTWTEGIMPKGDAFERAHPTVIDYHYFDKKSTHGAFVAHSDHLKAIIITYRPASTSVLWWFNVRQWRTEPHSLTAPTFLKIQPARKIPPKMSVHFGFQKLYMTFRNEMMAAIKNTADKYPDYRIMFIGSSLGAAVAELAAVDFAYNLGELGYMHRIETQTTGTPRTGSKIWADFVDSLDFKKTRLVAWGDPVPHLPPTVTFYTNIRFSAISISTQSIHSTRMEQ
jgi:Lipase (class 3)